MVNVKEVSAKLQEYSEQIQNLNNEREELLERRSVEVFFSFDIVNSSMYKTLEQYDNLIEKFKLQEGYGIIEFLGNDIDAGFRIKTNTQDRRLVISYDLAYILSRDTDYLKNIHIITYKCLKGIWHNRLYPVIWYYDQKFVEGIPFEDSFYYDEIDNCMLVKEYFSNRTEPALNRDMYDDIDHALTKILIAEVIGEVDMDCGKRMKHSKIRWIEESEVEGFSEPAVPDFKNTLKMVFDRLKEGT